MPVRIGPYSGSFSNGQLPILMFNSDGQAILTIAAGAGTPKPQGALAIGDAVLPTQTVPPPATQNANNFLLVSVGSDLSEDNPATGTAALRVQRYVTGVSNYHRVGTSATGDATVAGMLTTTQTDSGESGNIDKLKGHLTLITHGGSGTINTSTLCYDGNVNLSGSGTIPVASVFHADDHIVSGSGAITESVGLQTESMGQAKTNNVGVRVYYPYLKNGASRNGAVICAGLWIAAGSPGNFDLGDQSNALPIYAGIYIEQPNLTASVAKTVTAAVGLYVAGPPKAGTNVTITSQYAAFFAAGLVGNAGAEVWGPQSPAYANPLTIGVSSATGATFYDITTTAGVGNATLNASGTGVAGQLLVIRINNDATSGRTITFGTNFRSAGTVTGTVSKAITVTFISNGAAFVECFRTATAV